MCSVTGGKLHRESPCIAANVQSLERIFQKHRKLHIRNLHILDTYSRHLQSIMQTSQALQTPGAACSQHWSSSASTTHSKFQNWANWSYLLSSVLSLHNFKVHKITNGFTGQEGRSSWVAACQNMKNTGIKTVVKRLLSDSKFKLKCFSKPLSGFVDPCLFSTFSLSPCN